MRRSTGVALALLWVLLFALTLTLSVLAATHDILPADEVIAHWMQDLPFPGKPLSDTVRTVTSTEVVLAIGYAAAVALWIKGCRRKALLLAAGLAVLPLLQAGVKEMVDRPRPDPTLVERRASFSSPSFPSGHVMSPSYLGGFLLYLSWRLPLPVWPRVILIGWSVAALFLTGPANIYLGVHWPSDVLGGYAWGLVLLLPLIVADAAWPGGRQPSLS